MTFDVALAPLLLVPPLSAGTFVKTCIDLAIQLVDTCSRRTAMRMRDEVLRAFPAAEELPGKGQIKRWRIPPGTLERILDLSGEEFAVLEMAKKLLDRDNRKAEASMLGALALKLRAVLHASTSRRVELLFSAEAAENARD